MNKLLFIFNPQSGKAKIKNQLFDIIQYYTNNGYLTTIYPTQSAGDGYAYLKNMDEEYDLIVCSGGDGTLNEVISGIVDSGKHRVLGYLPSGSTNDFGRSVGIPSDMENALNITCFGKPCGIDVGSFNDKHFIYVAGFGAFTRVPYSTPQRRKNTLGYLAYILQGILELPEIRSYQLSMEYDGECVEGEFIVGFIMNSFSIAGFRNPAGSLTELNDGLFEVLLVKAPMNIVELQNIIASLLNGNIESEYIFCVQASNIKIHSELIEWTLDGEYGGKYEDAVIVNQKQEIQILINE